MEGLLDIQTHCNLFIVTVHCTHSNTCQGQILDFHEEGEGGQRRVKACSIDGMEVWGFV